jgi:hypothetical protein
MSIKVVYEDVSPLAKADSTATSTDKQSYVDMGDLSQLELTPFGNYALCLPRYSKLDGRFENAPNSIPTSGNGYVSDSLSDSEGLFETNPVIEITFSQKHTAVGLTLVFNELSGDYCNDVNIKWYDNTTLLADEDYAPNDTSYFCEKNVELFNKIVIEFKATSRPYRYVFLAGGMYGVVRTYKDNEVARVNLLNELSQISEELTINTFGWTLISANDTEYLFQKQQGMKLYDDDQLLGSYYIDNAKRKSDKVYEINCYDAVGILDQTQFMGGIYTGQSATTVLDAIFDGSNINYTIDNVTALKTIYGYIPIMTKREALNWVCMATGSVVDTTRSTTVDIYRLNETIQRTIDTNSQYTGLQVENTQIVTGVKVTSYSYSTTNTSEEIFSDTLNGTATIEFGEPYHSLSISGGTITSSGVNYAVISGTGSTVTLTGKKYKVQTRITEKNNENVGALDLKNVLDISGCTIISHDIAEEVAQRVLGYYLRTKKVSAKIVFGENDLGDYVTINSDFEGNITGHIEKLEISGNNKLAGKVVIR